MSSKKKKPADPAPAPETTPDVTATNTPDPAPAPIRPPDPVAADESAPDPAPAPVSGSAPDVAPAIRWVTPVEAFDPVSALPVEQPAPTLVSYADLRRQAARIGNDVLILYDGDYYSFDGWQMACRNTGCWAHPANDLTLFDRQTTAAYTVQPSIDETDEDDDMPFSHVRVPVLDEQP